MSHAGYGTIISFKKKGIHHSYLHHYHWFGAVLFDLFVYIYLYLQRTEKSIAGGEDVTCFNYAQFKMRLRLSKMLDSQGASQLGRGMQVGLSDWFWVYFLYVHIFVS